MNMDDLLNALGQASSSQGASNNQPDLGDLLGGALGGRQPSSTQPDLGSLLGGLLGGGASASGSQMDPGGLLGALLGGGQSASGMAAGGTGSLLDAIIVPFAQKLGLSPQVASMVVTFLMNALISGKLAGRSSAAAVAPQGMDLGQAIAGFGGSKTTPSRGANNQLVQELSQETGLDEKTAVASVDEFVNLLGGQESLDRLLGAR